MGDLQLVRTYDSQIPSKVLYIDSRDATQYLSTDINTGKDLTSYFLYSLEEKIEVPENQVIFVSLNSATIPYSFYNIREGVNDTLFFKVLNWTSGSPLNEGTGNITLPKGNYSAISLGDTLEGLLLTTTSGTTYLITITISFNTDTGKFDFTIIGRGSDAGKTLRITLLYATSTLRTEIGLSADLEILTNTSSQNFVDVNGSIHGLYIRSNLTSSTTMDSNNGTFSNILERLPIKVQPGGVLFREPSNSGHKALTYHKNISSIQIRLTDDRNRLLDLNGLHFQIAVQFDFDYLQNIIPPLNAEQRRLIGYGVDSSMGASVKAQADIKVSEKQRLEQEILKMKKKVGRPRKVGRPKGT